MRPLPARVEWIVLVTLTALPVFAQQPVSETITVTATRTEARVADTPASVVVLSRRTLEATAALTPDDALRQVPGFTLFRRTGSRVANPTTQGVSLRGIGASGASRALVLDDGIPLNDPFGGWVYWGRVARPALERVEVVRGGASDLYGSAAMGGVVQFIRRRDQGLSGEISAGSQSTRAGSLFVGLGSLRVAADLLDTEGYILVAPGQRGAVDRPADAEHTAVDASWQHERFFVRGSHYSESRNNGTPLQTNATTIRQLALGGGSGGAWRARGWFGDQDYEQTFSAIASDRASERLTAEQRVPSRNAGGSLQWTHLAGTRHALLAGVEAQRVSATVEESRSQTTSSLFVEDVAMLTPRWTLTAGARLDHWRDQNEISPRLALLYRPDGAFSYALSAYRAFRAPTLNELHRPFRVGNVLTLANEDLTAERLTAVEAGVRARDIRATLFWMELDDVIANVTLTATPALITRQRRNVATSRSRGAEIEGEWRIGPNLQGSLGYLFADATTGDKRTPQVPRNQATAQLTYSGPLTMSVQSRWSAMQFDDDRNELPLHGYFVADLFVSRAIGEDVAITLAAENVFDERIEAGATPVITLGQPRAIRIGLRYSR
jgi:outer membrane receptor protein involved in Fe transport